MSMSLTEPPARCSPTRRTETERPACWHREQQKRSRCPGAASACRKSPPAGSSCGRSRRNKIESVISGGVYVGNDTSHERQSDFFPGPHKNHGFPGVQGKPWFSWERRSSGGNEYPGLHGYKRSAACDDDIEDCLSCSSSRKSGLSILINWQATFSTVSGPPRDAAAL